MPELPEVEALKDFLTEHVVGHEIVRALPVAISVLKTYDPPLTAVEGHEVTAVHRYGKFLDLVTDGGPHLVTHLARAGWLHWKDKLPDGPPRPGKGPLALRVALETGAGFDLTEAGTQKRLAVYVVQDPQEVPGVARLGPDPLADDFDEARLAALLKGERRQLKGALRDQGLIAGCRQRVQRRDPARGEDVPLQTDLIAHPTGDHEAVRGPAHHPHRGDRAFRGVAVGRLKSEKKSGLRVHGRTGEPCPVCGETIREVSFSDSSLQYCPTCQTGGKPLADHAAVQAAEVGRRGQGI